MKNLQHFSTVFFLGLSMVTLPSALASSEFVFPLPVGNQLLTTDYKLHDTYLDFPQFSLDFQGADIPKGVSTDVQEARCYTYGMPILAARDGVVEQVESDDRRHVDESYGSYVSVRHADHSLALYAHMIFQSNTAYVKPGDHVRQGQILGLMGDTGNIHSSFESTPCDQDGNYGSHLHFEIRDLKNSSGRLIPAEPLGDSADKNFTIGSIYPSDTYPYDPNNIYVQYHAGKYPYVLQIEEVYSLSPLEVSTGAEVKFHLVGNYFHPGSVLTMPFCSTQTTTVEDAQHATIDCRLKSGPWQGVFPNVHQEGGLLHYELGSGGPGKSSIQEVDYITPKPGEFLNLTIVGQDLSADLDIIVEDEGSDGENGSCDFGQQFASLSPDKVVARCRMPLNLGPVAAKVNRNFSITIYESAEAKRHGDRPLYSSRFDTSYGISGTELTPRKADYYTPTRFTITGKNVQRTTIFYIEGCAKKDLKIISQQYDQLILECLIQPLPNTDLKSLAGKTFQHLFLFKTKSRQNDQGENILNDQEDQDNIVLSGYITMTYDNEQRIDSLEPQQAIVGTETTFTVRGNHLPYSDDGQNNPLLALSHCPGTGADGGIEILPHSYTPYGFEFKCTPVFSTHLGPKKQDAFDINAVDCNRIIQHQWTEDQKNKALEKCYETDDREVKKAMWKNFDVFFSGLAARVLELRKEVGAEKKLIAKKETHVISALYDFIKREETFQFQFTRHDGDYQSSGEPSVSSIMIGTITTTNRQQPITVTGTSLPRDLILKSDECGQIAITFGSSERFEAVCLLQKVPLEEIAVIQESKMKELSRKSSDIVEVYHVEAGRSAADHDHIQISATGVHLKGSMRIESPQCDNPHFSHEPSTTQLLITCDTHAGVFSQAKELQLKIFTVDNILLFENTLPIDENFVVDDKSKQGSITLQAPAPQVPPPEQKSIAITENDFFGLKCLAGNDQTTFLGDCTLSSPFFHEAKVQAFYNRLLKQAVVNGTLASSDQSSGQSVSIAGMRFTPLTGDAVVAADIPDKSLMVSGDVSGVGIDAAEAVGFPLSLKLADYQGSLLLHYPSFDLNKARADSNIVLGLGKLEGGQMDKLWAQAQAAVKAIAELLLKSNPEEISAGKALSEAILHGSEKAKTFIPSISLFKVIDLIPETVAFYDNFDFVAHGKLKSQPFLKTSTVAFDADLGSFDIDLDAHDGQLKIQGTAVNKLRILNNDILKTDKSVVEAGLTVQLKKDEGTVDLDPVEIHLPGDLATASADAHITHLFDLANLSTWGHLRAGVQVMGIELAKAGAYFRYDPNGSYRVAGENADGIFQLAAQLKLLVLLAEGNAIFTVLDHQLVMDLGGNLELDFLNTREKIADALSRSRLGNGQIKTCLNSRTGEITFYNPLVHHDTTLSGGLSFETEVDTTGFFSTPKTVAMSGQWEKGNRTGLKYDGTKNLLSAFSEYSEPCTDVPGDEFLKSIVAEVADRETAKHFSLLDALIPRVLAAEEETPAMFNASWDLTGWKSISVDPQNGNDVGIFDAKGQAVPLNVDVPGIWDVPGPHAIIITDAAAFAKTGYHIEIIRKNDLPTTVETRTVVGNQSIIDHFAVGQLKPSGNAVDLGEISPGKQLTINGAAQPPTETRTETFTADDLRIKADVKSDPLPKAPSAQTTFTDIRSPELKEAVAYLVDKGVIKGYPDGTFRPEKTINRAEALKMIFAAKGYSSDGAVDQEFPDVPRGEWYFTYIGIAKSAGIISGYPDGTFRPNQEVNRAEFVKMAMQAEHALVTASDNDAALKQYSDLDGKQWYMPYIAYAFEQHFLDAAKKFKPTAGMSRGDAALMIFKILKSPI